MVLHTTLTTDFSQELKHIIWVNQVPFTGDAKYYVAVIVNSSVMLQQFENTDYESLINEIRTYLNKFNPLKIEVSVKINNESLSVDKILYAHTTLSLKLL
ncbi:MAG TPA: hypothetical protein PLL09_04610 [Flavobacterium sp.]|uniref:hypothetical protein n=1 Tax=unclassified Flavobacterium TaxID=196869 RepID=UPI0025C22CF1|nr:MULTISPECIES: hypothetical protein [unclassified Flavobacterium]HRE77090.1 hypothetical protein [Flavobacterium sp.]